jgi:hypothetical protein
MERIRRISALLIAVSLLLPERSCVNAGRIEIYYPLSSADSAGSVAVIVAFYTLPLILVLITRFRPASLVAGMAVVAAGLYFISYGAALVATQLLAGWYTYTLGAVTYLVASLLELQKALRARRAQNSPSPSI